MSNYWWLNANPEDWSFSNIDVGETVGYTLYNESGNKHHIFKNFLDAKKGDMVICYDANSVRKVVAIGKISIITFSLKIYITCCLMLLLI